MIRRDAGLYVLDEHGEAVLEPSLERWSAWMHENGRVLADDGPVVTVFLAVDHSERSGDDPELWQTTIGCGPDVSVVKRHTTRGYALDWHRCAVSLLGSGVPTDP